MKHPHQHKNLHIIPYVAGLAEYAGQVRTEIMKREESDFIIAVDLPLGLEDQIQAAAHNLPTISVVIDQVNRAIPIIPSSAPIEAVRSFEDYGYDLKFIDASLPVTGDMQEFQYFIAQCSNFGIERVLGDPESYGISLRKLFEAWYGRSQDRPQPALFAHCPEITRSITTPPYTPEQASPYLRTRLQYMAMHLQSLQESGIEILLVCSHHLVNGILHYLDTPLPRIDDRYVLPTKTCIVAEEDIPSITSEIPYFCYLYELFRDLPVEREEWIRSLYQETGYVGLSPDLLASTIRYASRLALTDADVIPDLFNLVAAAKYVVEDAYALKVLELARTYPPAKHATPNCRLRNLRDYNLSPLGDARTLTLKQTLLDSVPGHKRKRRKNSAFRSGGYIRFTRTPESYEAEREFMRYVTARFTSRQPSEDECVPEEYTCGLQEGIDVRETLRHRPTGRIYVKEPVLENTASYVFDYRSVPATDPGSTSGNPDAGESQPRTPSLQHASHFFFDKNYSWAGIGLEDHDHYLSKVLLSFAKLDVSPTTFFSQLKSSDPLVSAVHLGLKHARHAFVFTDTPEELDSADLDRSRIRVHPCSAIPAPIFDKMREFDVAYWRNDDKPGD